MKGANILVDVDLTLVDANGRLQPEANGALVKLRGKLCHPYLWSSVRVENARKVAALHQRTEMFQGFAAKPGIIIDAMPSTAVSPFIFNVRNGSSRQALADEIIIKHVD